MTPGTVVHRVGIDSNDGRQVSTRPGYVRRRHARAGRHAPTRRRGCSATSSRRPCLPTDSASTPSASASTIAPTSRFRRRRSCSRRSPAGRSRILLGSAVTVLSTDDPVRVFQRFSTLDALSNGRAEVILGRGSFTESYPLFGYDLSHYEELFEDKLALFAELLKGGPVTWSGSTRTALTGVTDLSADRERHARDLDRRRRQPGIGRARGALRPAADARDHRRQPGALPARSSISIARRSRSSASPMLPVAVHSPGTSPRPTSRRRTSCGRTTRR